TRDRFEARCEAGETALCLQLAIIRLDHEGEAPEAVAPALAETCAKGLGCSVWLDRVVGRELSVENEPEYETICRGHIEEACIALAYAYTSGRLAAEDPIGSARTMAAQNNASRHMEIMRWVWSSEEDRANRSAPMLSIEARRPCDKGEGPIAADACALLADFIEMQRMVDDVDDMFAFRKRACELGHSGACAWLELGESENTVRQFFRTRDNKEFQQKFLREHPDSIYAKQLQGVVLSPLEGIESGLKI